jgi:hypothetical protein
MKKKNILTYKFVQRLKSIDMAIGFLIYLKKRFPQWKIKLKYGSKEMKIGEYHSLVKKLISRSKTTEGVTKEEMKLLKPTKGFDIMLFPFDSDFFYINFWLSDYEQEEDMVTRVEVVVEMGRDPWWTGKEYFSSFLDKDDPGYFSSLLSTFIKPNDWVEGNDRLKSFEVSHANLHHNIVKMIRSSVGIK